MHKGVAAAGCAVFIAVSLAGCGTEQISAGTKVEQAFDRLDRQKAVTMTFGFDGTEQQVWTAMKGRKDFTRDDAKMLAGLDVSVSTSSAGPLKDKKKDRSVALRVSQGKGKDLLEVRRLGGRKQLFMRADIERLMALTADNGDAESKAAMKEFGAFVDAAGDLPSNYRSVKDALTGKWVSIDPQAFEEFSKNMGPGSGGKSPLPDMKGLSAKEQRKISDALGRTIRRNARFTDKGTRNGVDHVTVTLPTQKTADAVIKAFEPVESRLPDGVELASLKDIPAKKLDLDVAIKDGAVAGITIDIAQLDRKTQGRLPLSVRFAPDAGPVKAPAGASALDPQDVMGAAMQFMMGRMNA
ncbi:hypothetical protein [Streptomyces meridianus]|uniref:Lipoprotein n=1 Tax=Streptomyces meridianus TaxID=2938945 RepID=A0ABT0X088_9ACTN|nr:hypothetical protein [Streptomyces meridianus]MCM2575986.1 hypothetical protein [Streptomyces meridianus]